MRKFYYIALGLLLACAAYSCVNNEVNYEEVVPDNVMTFTAYSGSDGETKTELGDGGAVLWSPYDSIGVYYSNGSNYGYFNKCVSDNSQSSGTALFKGNVPDANMAVDKNGYYYGVYPYSEYLWFTGSSAQVKLPSLQYAKKGSFGEGMFPSVAKSKDSQLYFYNVYGGIKISVSKPGVKRITLRSNDGEAVAGDFYANFEQHEDDKGEIPYINGWGTTSDYIDLIAPDGGFEVGEPYYIILRPATYSQGFTLTFTTQTESAERVVNKEVVIKRSVFSKMTAADKTLTYTKLPTAEELLCGEDGLKYWIWDTTSESDETTWGASAGKGNGYVADSGQIPEKWWSYRPEYLLQNLWQAKDGVAHGDESRFAYMMIDSKGTCISYSEEGKEIRRGSFNVSDFDPSSRVNGWQIGKFKTDAPAILWPYVADSGGREATEFDILRLTDDYMILGSSPSYLTDGGGTYTWWRFRSISKSDFQKGKPTGISLDKANIEAYQGDWITFDATITPEDCSFWGVAWTVDNENVLYYQGNNQFYVQNEGSAKVTAMTAGGQKAECVVTVKTRIPVETFYLDMDFVEMHEGQTVTVKATVLPENATLKDVEWTCQDTSVATVDSDGTITAVSPGWASVVASTDGGRSQCWCNVYVRSNSVERVELDKYNLELYPGDKETITATVYPEYAKNKDVRWESLNTEIVTVDDSGTVTAICPGWANVRAISEDTGYEAWCCINVLSRPVTGVTIDKTEVELYVGASTLLTANVLPENATNTTVSWSSDKSSVATIDRNGVLRAVSSGHATITVKTQDGGFTSTCNVTVRTNGMDPGIGDWEDGEHHSGGAY